MFYMEKLVEDEIDKVFDNLEYILWNRCVNLKKILKSNVLSKQSYLKVQEDNFRRMKLDIEEFNKFVNQIFFFFSVLVFFQVRMC